MISGVPVNRIRECRAPRWCSSLIGQELCLGRQRQLREVVRELQVRDRQTSVGVKLRVKVIPAIDRLQEFP